MPLFVPALAGPTGATGAAFEVTASSGVTCTAGTSVGNVDTLLYTVPASPSGNGRFNLSGLALRLGTALVGSGNVVLTAGTTQGGTDLILAQTVTSATAVGGSPFGLPFVQLGATFDQASGDNAYLAAGTPIWVRLATSGTVTTGPVFSGHVYGMGL